MSRRTYAGALEASLRGVALPYGYTLTIWATGEIVTHSRGKPSAWEVALFVAGAALAFGCLRWSTRRIDPSIEPTELGGDPHIVRAGALQIAAMAAALAGAAVLGSISSAIAWPAGAFAATLLYLLGTAVELAPRARELDAEPE
jgi:hypothetical protein